jgi:hypothetical protein
MNNELKPMFIRLPADLVRSIKVDVAMSDRSLQDWFKEAAETKLQEHKRERENSAA